MAKSSRRNSGRSGQAGRTLSPSYRPYAVPRLRTRERRYDDVPVVRVLDSSGDVLVFPPDGPLESVRSEDDRVVHRRKASVYYPPSRSLPSRISRPSAYDVLRYVRYANPSRVLMCVKRQVRRQVLFAIRKAGFSGSARKKHWRRTRDSFYGC